MKTIDYFFIFLIKFYKYLISPYLPSSCRYQPTCSEYFIDCIRNNISPMIDIEDALKTQKIIDAAFESSHSKKLISLI